MDIVSIRFADLLAQEGDESGNRNPILCRTLGERSRIDPKALRRPCNALGRGLGLSDDVAYRVLSATPLAAQAERRRPAIAAGDYPPRFALALARKDADLIAAAATGRAELRLVEATRSWLVDAEVSGLAPRDYTAILARILGAAEGRRPEPASHGPKPPPDYDDCAGLVTES